VRPIIKIGLLTLAYDYRCLLHNDLTIGLLQPIRDHDFIQFIVLDFFVFAGLFSSTEKSLRFKEKL